MFEYQKHHKYFAVVTGSLEKHAAEELHSLGAEVLSEEYRGIRFTCKPSVTMSSSPYETLYRILYCSRLIQRLLVPLISFQCHSEKYLYSQAQNIDWTAFFDRHPLCEPVGAKNLSPKKLCDGGGFTQSFSIITNLHNSHINNSLYAGQVLKDVIVDQCKSKYNLRPNFTPKDGDIVLSLYIEKNWATISLDISGNSMHKRGYRTKGNIAPIQETIAAAIVKLSGWVEKMKATSLPHSESGNYMYLTDPMCGSGTILAEALMRFCNIPAGYLRDHKAIKNLPDFDQTIWNKLVSSENSKITPLPAGLISGSDIDPACIETTRENLQRLPFGENIALQVADFRDLPLQENRVVICNPPYGVRLGKADTITKLYNDIGDFLKQKCPNSEAYILCGKKDLIPALRLRAHWKKTLMNGNIETKLVKIIIKK